MADKQERQFAPDEINKDGEYIKIGGSPVSGITLRHILRGHTNGINRMAWSPDGRYLASPSDDNTIRIWEVTSGECITVFNGHTDAVFDVAWSLDGQRVVSSSKDHTIRMWSLNHSKQIMQSYDEGDWIVSVMWSPDGRTIMSGSRDGSFKVWDAERLTVIKAISRLTYGVVNITWSPNDFIVATGSGENSIKLWDAKSYALLRELKDHSGTVWCIAWFNDGKKIASASGDGTIKLWDVKTGQLLSTIEGHTRAITHISFSNNDKLLASKSADNTVQFWRMDTLGKLVSIVEQETDSTSRIPGLEFHPKSHTIATLGATGTIIRIWDIDYGVLIGTPPETESLRYTTAKLVLVGDSGVGKTGLGWRLAHNKFKEHSSTHGQQFWVVPELRKTREDGTECEAVLWDLAGQHIYRSIHSIFLDDVDASLVLFDPTNRQEPLKGAQFWLEQLKGRKQLPPSVLVGARLDRGAPVLSQQELDQFCQKYGISGGYIGTSAKSGEGLDKLVEALKDQIPWDQMTTTVTTVTFKKIKDYVLALKEKTDRKGVLVRPAELRKQLQAMDKDWEFTDAEMMTAVGHLANHGYVIILRSSSGEKYILLVPELLASVASSIFLHADKHPRELGAINETDLLQGRYPIEEFKGLEEEEQHVLLDATVVRFLEHSLCFREALGNDNLLIFPSLIKQKRPLKDDVPATDDISYIVRGRVENIYASLVVLLGYTSSFTRINQWANQAQYETEDGDICGFRLVEDREGEIELILYYANEMEKEERADFRALFEQFLYKRDVEVTPFPPVACPNGHSQERATVVKSLREGKKAIFCYECGAPTELPDLEAQQTIGIDVSDWLKREEALARLRNVYETYLVNVKGYRRGWESPRCYLSYTDDQKDFAGRLARDLTDAGIFIIEDSSKVEVKDNVIIIDSQAYKKAWEGNLIPDDIKLIKPRFASGKRNGLISISQSGPILEHDIRNCKSGSFCDPTHYVINLFNLILDLYEIPLNHAGFMPLRQSLHNQWEQTLAKKVNIDKEKSDTLKIFISYAHKDEEYKNELMVMLAGLERRGLIDIWQDREIEEGDEWLKEIEKAMNECDLALLFVSANFINSRFIQGNEVPRLLQRRKDEGLRVVPIILDHCLWESEPVLSDLQAMPRDAKPIITFPKENGERTRAWKEIAQAIEKRAKK